jgi:hypothetical protein
VPSGEAFGRGDIEEKYTRLTDLASGLVNGHVAALRTKKALNTQNQPAKHDRNYSFPISSPD